MDIILRITMKPQSVNLIFILGIVTTTNVFLHACFYSRKYLTTMNLQQSVNYLSSTSLHFCLYLSPLLIFITI